MDQLAELTQPQRDRLAFVELRVRFVGEIRRQDLVTRFSIQSAAATRDLALYKELAPGNIHYDSKGKAYILGDYFRPVFDYPAERVMSWLTQGFGDGEPMRIKTWVSSAIPSRLTQPDLDVLSNVTRAIHQGCPLVIEYYSVSSGRSERQIVPFALIDNGLRWHVRAFDRKSQEFRDFVITRIKNPRLLKEDTPEPHELSDQDIQWTRIVELELVPHPDRPYPEITEMDYGMRDGVLRMKLRAAIVGYVLRKWSVDCSADHSLSGAEYRLWLRDSSAIYGAKNAVLAPGFSASDMKRTKSTKESMMPATDSSKTSKRFYAHSTDRKDRSDWQLLGGHLTSVARLAAEFAKVFNADGLAHIAGLLHDLGKYTEEVQRRVAGENIRVEHAVQGARQAIKCYGERLGVLLAYIIAGHHTGLANGRDRETRSSLKERLARSGTPELLSAWQTEVSLPMQCPLPKGFKPHPDSTLATFQLAFLTRMLYSCVVDADFLDTEAFYDTVENRPSLRGSGPSLSALQVELNKTLSKFKADSEVNQLRADILRHVREQAALPPGLFSLTVPTGGGKTLTSLAFALDHALAHQSIHGFRRVIYVIPFTSIIEQNAAEFRKALGELGETAVLEHHSAFDDSKLKDQNSRDKLRRATENWDRPVVVTTAVQFFESLFADRSSRCRKLHNIAGSVIILDEAQTLPLKLLRPCVVAIDELARNYRCSVVLCTATQPALNANENNPSEGFPNGLTHVRELAPEPKNLYCQLERVRVTHIGEQDDEALAKRLKENPQVLCIVNNRRHARALFDAIRNEPGARHLSTFMCARHRSQVIEAIRDDLLPKNNRPCRLISTSLIEAGVNLDFPYVLRAEAGLDSVAQAAGRCNREGRRARDDSLVHIFLSNAWPSPSELRQFAQAMRLTLGHHADNPLSLGAIDAYFRELYWQKGDEALDARNILGLIRNGGIDGIPFETVTTQFRMIDNVQHPIIVPFKADGEEVSPVRALLDKLRFAGSPGAIARALQPYTVQVPKAVFDALRNAGAVQPKEEKRFGEQFMVLVNEDLYDVRVGLLWENPAFVEAEKTVW